MLIPNLHKLTFDRFMDIAVEGDLSLLIIEGEPSKEELEDKWEELLSEFNEKMGGPKGEVLIGKRARAEALKGKVQLIETLLRAWLDFPRKFYADALVSLGLRKTAFASEESWNAQKSIVLAQIRSRLAMVTRLEAELGPLETTGDNKPTYDGFEKCLTAISIHQKREINAKDISTFRFCEYYNRLVNSPTLKDTADA